jgi:hypothetical protein
MIALPVGEDGNLIVLAFRTDAAVRSWPGASAPLGRARNDSAGSSKENNPRVSRLDLAMAALVVAMQALVGHQPAAPAIYLVVRSKFRIAREF